MAAELLADESTLTRKGKVWYRRDAVLAAHHGMFGQPVDELDKLTMVVVNGAVPLFPKAGATERGYSTTTTIQREERIRATVDRGMEQPAAPGPSARIVDKVIREQERKSGHAMTAGQRSMVVGICGNGRRISLVEGLAGAGKSTALDAVRAAFEAANFRVLGAATSGTAALSLEESAHLAKSSTVCSLLWLVRNDRLRLGPKDLIALDEAGMTDDKDWEALLETTEAAGARLIPVGHSKQLSAVGPGGALEAATSRHGGQTYFLTVAVRFKTPGEAEALERLQAGDIDAALAWYVEHDRIHWASTRDEVVEQMVEAWTAGPPTANGPRCSLGGGTAAGP